MTNYIEGNECYYLIGPQNSKDQIKKRSGTLYCYALNIYISSCNKEKCRNYYSVDARIVDNLS